jgi:hypothetical protein
MRLTAGVKYGSQPVRLTLDVIDWNVYDRHAAQQLLVGTDTRSEGVETGDGGQGQGGRY